MIKDSLKITLVQGFWLGDSFNIINGSLLRDSFNIMINGSRLGDSFNIIKLLRDLC